jgi:lipopolysaccharide export system protein LptA
MNARIGNLKTLGRIIIMALLMSHVAQAQTTRFAADANAPIDLSAAKMVWQQNDARAALTGGASIVQGALTLTADTMQLVLDAGGVAERLTARGNVRLADSQQTATAQEAVYQLAEGQLTLSGDVSLVQAQQGTLRGARLILDMNNGQARLSGGAKTRARIELKR